MNIKIFNTKEEVKQASKQYKPLTVKDQTTVQIQQRVNTREMSRDAYYRAYHWARRIMWLTRNSLIPVQGRSDNELAESIT